MSTSLSLPIIEIKYRTNIRGIETNVTSVTSDLFYRPKKKGAVSDSPLTAVTTRYPYFRSDVKFAKSMLDGTTAYQFFFNKTQFLIGVTNATKVSKLDEDQTARENVMFLLKHLFVTSFPIPDNLETSFDVNIQKTNTLVAERNSFLPKFIVELFETHQESFTYITQSALNYTVLGVTWMNDVVNHPLYFKLMNQIKKYILKKEEKVKLIEKKLKTFLLPKLNLDLLQKVANLIEDSSSELTQDIYKLIGKSKLGKVFTGNKDEDEDKEKLMEKLTPLVYKIYVLEQDLNKHYYKRGRQTQIDYFTQNPYFKQFMNISKDYYLNLSLKNFFAGSSMYKDTLLDSNIQDKITELYVFQDFIVTDVDFCAMLSQISEFVSPEQIKRPKNFRFSETSRLGWLSAARSSATDEKNPILKKVKFLTQHYVSTNQNFQNAIENYFKSGCSDTNFENIVKNGPVDEAIRLSKDGIAASDDATSVIPNVDWLKVDAVKRISEETEKEKYWYYDERPVKDKKPAPFVIEIQLELMQGIVDEKNAPKIYCAFEDTRLQNEFFRLKAKLDKTVFYKPRPFLSIGSFIKQKKGGEAVSGGGGKKSSRRRCRRPATRIRRFTRKTS